MKVLLFTHISDIDGINNVVLAKLAFKNIDYVLCEAAGVDEEIQKKLNSFDKYEMIFITDLCPTDKMLGIINNSSFKDKIKVFDHHKGALDLLTITYDFVNITIENDKGLCCGTSLFYEYLIKNNFLKESTVLNELVELTRKYDTWEWTKDNTLLARDLTWLLNASGIDRYLKKIMNRVKQEHFSLIKNDYIEIHDWKKKLDEIINKQVDKVIYLNIDGYKAGIITTIYEYRNDVTEYVRKQKLDIDFLALVFTDKDSISYRSVKENVDVNEIAKQYGGKGHVNAASSPITFEEKNNIIAYFCK